MRYTRIHDSCLVSYYLLAVVILMDCTDAGRSHWKATATSIHCQANVDKGMLGRLPVSAPAIRESRCCNSSRPQHPLRLLACPRLDRPVAIRRYGWQVQDSLPTAMPMACLLVLWTPSRRESYICFAWLRIPTMTAVVMPQGGASELARHSTDGGHRVLSAMRSQGSIAGIHLRMQRRLRVDAPR